MPRHEKVRGGLSVGPIAKSSRGHDLSQFSPLMRPPLSLHFFGSRGKTTLPLGSSRGQGLRVGFRGFRV